MLEANPGSTDEHKEEVADHPSDQVPRDQLQASLLTSLQFAGEQRSEEGVADNSVEGRGKASPSKA